MDWFLFDAKIWLGKGRFCQAMIIRQGRIAAVGTRRELYHRAQGCSFLSCGGRTVLPGFSDACLCLCAAGSTLPAGRDGLKGAVQTAMASGRGRGGHLFWPGGGARLSSDELEDLWPHSPLLLEDVAARRGWANRKAVDLLLAGGLPQNLRPYLETDGEGLPTGALSGPACRRLALRMPQLPLHARKEQLRQLLLGAARVGITSVCSIDPWIALDGRDRALLEQITSGWEGLPELRFYCRETGKQPDGPGTVLPPDGLSKGLWQPGQLLVPAEDGPALDLVLEQLEAHPLPPGNFRRLTLLGCANTTPQQLRAVGARQLGVIAFPGHLEEALLACAGQTAAHPDTCCAWRTLSGLGAHVAFGGLDRLAPMAALKAAVSREGKEALSAEAALSCWTAGSAWVDFREDSSGRLLPGYRADLQVLEGDVFSLPPEAWPGLRPVAVMAAGQMLCREI